MDRTELPVHEKPLWAKSFHLGREIGIREIGIISPYLSADMWPVFARLSRVDWRLDIRNEHLTG